MTIDPLTRSAELSLVRLWRHRPLQWLPMLLCLSVSIAFATDVMSQTTDFNIGPQPITSALHEWSRQSDVQVMVASDDVSDVRTQGVKGRFTAAAALSQLLQRTNLTYQTVGARTVTVRRIAAAATDVPQASPEPARSTGGYSSRKSDTEGKAATGRTMEEVVVTAQKRAQRLQDVPISISVLGGAELDKSTSQGMTESLTRVPGVSVTESYLGGGSQVPIRGVAAGLAMFTGASPTAYYLDSVPFGFSKTAIGPDPDVYDLERIEVLRGPQGTLYGANALNGVVRILTNDANPDAFEIKARGLGSSTEGGGENIRGDMAINVPIVDGKLAARAVLGYQDLSGWIDKANGKNVNDSERRNARLKINAQPIDELSIGLSAWMSRSDSGAPSAANDAGRRTSLVDEPISTDYDAFGLQARYELPLFSITSATSYLDYENHWILDINPAVGQRYDGAIPAKTFAQEFLLSSNVRGPWRWTAGAMYRDSEDSLTYFIERANVIRYYDTRTSESYAVFGELTRQFLAGKLEVTAGLRYFEDEVTLREIARADGSPATIRDDSKFDATTPRVVVTWHPADQLSAYASYSEGFRSGVYQSPSILATFSGFPQAEPDTLRNYEIGVKGNLLDGRLKFESSAFYIDWQDVQQSLSVLVPSLGTTVAAIVNGPSASSPGFELSLGAAPVDGLELGLSFSWNDLTLDHDVVTFPRGVPGGVVLYDKGDRLAWSSEYTAGGSIGYVRSLGDTGLDIGLSASANYTSGEEHQALVANARRSTQSDSILVGRANLFVGDRDRWTATLFVDNLTNEDGSPARHETVADWSVRIRPRTVGLQLEYSY